MHCSDVSNSDLVLTIILNTVFVPYNHFQFSSVQSLRGIQLFVTPWTAARQASLSVTNSQSYSNSCPLSRWCHPTISSSVISLSSCLQSFPASGSFQMKRLFFASGGQSIGVSASTSVLPKNIQELFPLGLTGLIFLLSKGLSRIFSSSTVQKYHNSLVLSLPYGPELPHPYMTTGKTIALTRWTFVGKLMSLLFNMLSRLVIAFLPRSKILLISWLKSPSAAILEPKKIKSITVSIVSPSICHEVMGPFLSFLSVES